MSGYYPDGVNQAIFDMYNQSLDDDEPEVIGSCELCGDDLDDEHVVMINNKLYCIDCSDSILDGDEI